MKMRRKMPRSVTSANGAGSGGKRGDQGAETGERRGARSNRLAVSRCAVVYSSRVELQSITPPTSAGRMTEAVAGGLGRGTGAHRGLRRIVVALPFTSIIEQTSEAFRDVLVRTMNMVAAACQR